nr:MAG TPA: hypothetical protein [Caudoviricetes sp.]
MAMAMKLLLLDPETNDYGNGLTAIEKMRGELVDFPAEWEIGISDKTGTSAMQSFIIYKGAVWDIVKNYYDMDNKVRIFMCIKSKETYDDPKYYDETHKKVETPKPINPPVRVDPTSVSYKAKNLIDRAIASAMNGAGKNEKDLAAKVYTALGTITEGGHIDMDALTPSEADEQAKMAAWSAAVKAGKHADACNITIYTIDAGSGIAYEVTEATLNDVAKKQTEEFVADEMETALSVCKTAKFTVGGNAREMFGKTYMGWVVNISLPEVAAKTTVVEKPEPDTTETHQPTESTGTTESTDTEKTQAPSEDSATEAETQSVPNPYDEILTPAT